MNPQTEFGRIMSSHTAIALATSVNNQANVRIVNFYYDHNRPGCLYFTSYHKNQKVSEFKLNPLIAFTTIPNDHSSDHVKAQQVRICISDRKIDDVLAGFTTKLPDYQATVESMRDQIILFEAHFSQAQVTLDVGQTALITC